jgi:hypothetical protein
MHGRVSIPIVLLIWLVIGVMVAVSKNYADNMENASQVATFVLAAFLWPIPALGGAVGVTF